METFCIYTIYMFPECVAKGSCLTWESEGRAVFARRCFRVRNRLQPSAAVRHRPYDVSMALTLGEAFARDL